MLEAAGHEIWTVISISMLTTNCDQKCARGAEELNIKTSMWAPITLTPGVRTCALGSHQYPRASAAMKAWAGFLKTFTPPPPQQAMGTPPASTGTGPLLRLNRQRELSPLKCDSMSHNFLHFCFDMFSAFQILILSAYVSHHYFLI
jgi:hypothetical protein